MQPMRTALDGRGGKLLERTAGGEDSRPLSPTHFLPRPPSPSNPLPRHLPRCPVGSPPCHGGLGCRSGQVSGEQGNFIMHDEFLYRAKARPGTPLVTGSVRHASRAAGGAVKHLLHSHLSAGCQDYKRTCSVFILFE